MKEFFKKRLFRWALREMLKVRANHDNPNNQEPEHLLNLWYEFSISQQSLFEKLYNHSHDIDRCKDPLAVREEIFFAQGKIEAWCEEICQGQFYIYFTDDEYLYFIERSDDALLFKMTWMQY